MRTSLFVMAMVLPTALMAQSTPVNAPPIVGPAWGIMDTTATYDMCWRGPEGVPYIWHWRITGSATIVDEPTGPDGKCTPVVVGFARTPGTVKIAYESSANGRPWPSPAARTVQVRWPTLDDSAGPYRLTGPVTRNGTIVAPVTSRTVTKSEVQRLTNGVSGTAPAGIRVVCADVFEPAAGWYPRARNVTIRRCERV